MSRLGAAVNIITTDGLAGRHGLTVSAVCSVTDLPPTLLVSINRASQSHTKLLANGVLCVNVLTGRHEDLSRKFAGGAAGEERFVGFEWKRLITGSPVLADASVACDCAISSTTDVGSHTILMCEVLAVALSAEPLGLVYFDRRYHAIS